jgi:hypothetical protein
MLAAMSSLATLAHTAAAPAFNGLFYATAATVIPVLYLAIAVQGRTYDDLLKAYVNMARRLKQNPGHWLQRAAGSVPTSVVVALATLLLLLGILGEIQALIILNWQSTKGLPLIVLPSAIGLAILVAAAAATALVGSMISAAPKLPARTSDTTRTPHP